MMALPAVSTLNWLPAAAGFVETSSPSQRVADPMRKQSMSAVLFVLFITCDPGMPNATDTNGGPPPPPPDLGDFVLRPEPLGPRLTSTSSTLSCDWMLGAGPISTVA